jgi:hypothetical protein
VYLIWFDPCEPSEAPEAETPVPEALPVLMASLQQAEVGSEIGPLAFEAGWSRIILDRRRRVLFLTSCGGSTVLGQIPLDDEAFHRILGSFASSKRPPGLR